MSKTVGNANNKLDIFRLSDTGTGYSILSDLTGSIPATTNAMKAYRLDMIEEAPIQYQEDGTIKLNVKQLADDSALNNVLNALAKPGATSSVRPERTLQDGNKVGGSSSSNLCLFVYYGGEEATDGVKTTVWIGSISSTSGSHTDKYNEWTEPTFEITGSLAKYDLTIIAALFDATVLDATDVGTKIPKINKGTCYERAFVTKAV